MYARGSADPRQSWAAKSADDRRCLDLARPNSPARCAFKWSGEVAARKLRETRQPTLHHGATTGFVGHWSNTNTLGTLHTESATGEPILQYFCDHQRLM